MNYENDIKQTPLLEKAIFNDTCMSTVGDLFSKPNIHILAIGPFSCLRVLYFRAHLLNETHRLFLYPVSRTLFAMGTHIRGIQKKLEELLAKDDVSSVILYISCADLLMRTDFENLIINTYNPKKKPIEIFKRGPLQSRKSKPKKTLEIIFKNIENHSINNRTEIKDKVSKTTYLPPLASDFSGVCSLLQDWNSLTILYSPGGCAQCITSVDETREELSFYLTRLNDIEVALCAEKKLIQGIREQISYEPKDLISILGTPVTNFTGTDFQGIIHSLKDLNKEIVAFPTNGFENYIYGVEQALLQLSKQCKKSPKIKQNKIYILGYTPLSIGRRELLDEAIINLKSCNFTVDFWNGQPLDNSLNWVVTPEGLSCAKYFKKEFDIPYIMDLPIGKYGMKKWLHSMETLTGLKTNANNIKLETMNYKNNKSIVIIGEPLTSISIARCLKNDFNLNNVTILSYGCHNGKSKKIYIDFSHIKFIFNKNELTKFIKNVDLVIADPIYDSLIKETNIHTKLIKIPYIGLSGRLFSKINYEFIGENGFNYFKSQLSNIRNNISGGKNEKIK